MSMRERREGRGRHGECRGRWGGNGSCPSVIPECRVTDRWMNDTHARCVVEVCDGGRKASFLYTFGPLYVGGFDYKFYRSGSCTQYQG